MAEASVNVIDCPAPPPAVPLRPPTPPLQASDPQPDLGIATPDSPLPDAGVSLPDADLARDFEDALGDAERLLKYAAEAGITVDAQTRDYVLRARTAGSDKWTGEIAADLLTALTTLAALLKPVTAESLKTCSAGAHRTVRNYWIVSVCLAVFIVPASVATFVSSAISTSISKDITTANDFAVKLTAQLEPLPPQESGPGSPAVTAATPLPPGISRVDVITELQSFASTMRSIDTRTRQLNWFILHAENDPFGSLRRDPAKLKEKFQLHVPLPADLGPVATDRILVYQDVRSFGQGVVDDVSVFYGAITICILPVLYALLGTCAYLLRSFEQDMTRRTFTAARADSPRFLIAGIGGAVVGLFNNFVISQGASIPPLAIAFLVGYAVDVFFSFLEGLIQTFSTGKSNSKIQAAESPGGK